jgi:hypothetical protein
MSVRQNFDGWTRFNRLIPTGTPIKLGTFGDMALWRARRAAVKGANAFRKPPLSCLVLDAFQASLAISLFLAESCRICLDSSRALASEPL